ncbi:MAG: 4Fe-4S cluster-binding domain-containing protein [Gammaproteobacteria bacterium]|nr:4Fe-4S cluster-binding domain-containing protein [Gammaproteobacteria bacterium]
MTIEVLPVGTRCALACRMCYQGPTRAAGNQESGDYNMEAMKRALVKENYKFTVFGGEPLLMPIDDLEELWRWGLERFGGNGVQTSATLVKERHYELFRKYKVGVGISLEGPGELNDIRWAGSLEKTREATKRAEGAVDRLLKEGHSLSLITTLGRGNASPERLSRLLDWFRDLDSRGLRHVNLHLLEIEDEAVRKEWGLNEKENAEALMACADLQSHLRQLRFQPIIDMAQLLLGNDASTSCNWNACDPYTTRAVRGVNGQGHLVNCGRTNKAGVEMQKADRELLVRALVLYHVPQEDGGCQGCRFWYACKGSCPGQGIGRDWRRKTEHCGTLQHVFDSLETRIASLGFRPVSSDKHRREAVEARMLDAFRAGNLISVHRALSGEPPASTKGGNREHGDVAHGDHSDVARPRISHGDHTDV